MCVCLVNNVLMAMVEFQRQETLPAVYALAEVNVINTLEQIQYLLPQAFAEVGVEYKTVEEIIDLRAGEVTSAGHLCRIHGQYHNVSHLRQVLRLLVAAGCLQDNQAKYFFDNGSTVVFAVFMSLWTVFFLEMWKRYSAEITHRWDVYGYDPEEVSIFLRMMITIMIRMIMLMIMIMMIMIRSTPDLSTWLSCVTVPLFWKMKLPGVLMSWTSVLMFILLAIMTIFAIILYRMSMVVALATVNNRYIGTSNI